MATAVMVDGRSVRAMEDVTTTSSVVLINFMGKPYQCKGIYIYIYIYKITSP